jgi:hypothetical protein
MQIRQSDLKAWARCPLAWKYKQQGFPDGQGLAAVYGTVIHACVEWMEINADLEGALQLFDHMWTDPQNLLGDRGRIDYIEYGRSIAKGFEEGPKALKGWWRCYQWESDVVLAREYPFTINLPNGHSIHGTIDRLQERITPQGRILVVADFKTAKRPTYDYLQDDLQFTMYCYASTFPEFWEGLPPGSFERYQNHPRYGEWLQVRGKVERLPAGVRNETHYRQLTYAIDAIARSIEANIFVPNISGTTCKFCSFRTQCGLCPAEREKD